MINNIILTARDAWSQALWRSTDPPTTFGDDNDGVMKKGWVQLENEDDSSDQELDGTTLTQKERWS